MTTYVFASDRWQDPDLVGSKYIWLPLTVKGTKLGMDYYDQWSLNLTTAGGPLARPTATKASSTPRSPS